MSNELRREDFMKSLIESFAIAASLCLVAGTASADPLDEVFYPADANGVLPMERVLDQARGSVAGTVTEIELEHEHGRLIYEVEILTPDRREVEIEYDARTGAELAREVKKAKAKKED
jgi:uncharacterized membrane protein YkoI